MQVPQDQGQGLIAPILVLVKRPPDGFLSGVAFPQRASGGRCISGHLNQLLNFKPALLYLDDMTTRSEPHSDIRSFYRLAHADISQTHCQGTACFAARHLAPDRWSEAVAQAPRVYCLGKCYAAPATGQDNGRPKMEVRSRQAVVLERIVAGRTDSLDLYRSQGGLAALEQALTLRPDQIIAEIESSELRGRGGAGFLTGAKWRTAASHLSGEKYVVANLDEGDPGAYVDRFIAEDDPFCLIEGMVIAALAVGAHKGWIYVRCEYPAAIQSLSQAIDAARATGLLGPSVLATDFAFDIELTIGQGSYVCGEETAMLNSIEHRRPVARARPPYVAVSGLWAKPTVVNNAETLSCVPWILRHGAAAYKSLGVPGSRGTKVVSLSSLFRWPGLYEIEFGIPLRKIVEDIGGGLQTGPLTGLMIGGPLAGVVPPSLLNTPFDFDSLRAIGASVGHGGIVAFDASTSIADLIEHVFSFGAYESCGECTPCRLGGPRIEQIFHEIIDCRPAGLAAQAEWHEIVAALKLTSLCGLGTGLAEFAESIARHYPVELRRCFK